MGPVGDAGILRGVRLSAWESGVQGVWERDSSWAGLGSLSRRRHAALHSPRARAAPPPTCPKALPPLDPASPDCPSPAALAPPVLLPSARRTPPPSGSPPVYSRAAMSIPLLWLIFLHSTFCPWYKTHFFFLIRRLPLVVGRMPPRQDAHVQIPGTCDCVPLHGRRDFAAVITDLKIGRLSWIIPWAWSNHRSPSELRTSSQWKHNWCCSRGSAGVTREKEGRSDGERRWPGRS